MQSTLAYAEALHPDTGPQRRTMKVKWYSTYNERKAMRAWLSRALAPELSCTNIRA